MPTHSVHTGSILSACVGMYSLHTADTADVCPQQGQELSRFVLSHKRVIWAAAGQPGSTPWVATHETALCSLQKAVVLHCHA